MQAIIYSCSRDTNGWFYGGSWKYNCGKFSIFPVGSEKRTVPAGPEPDAALDVHENVQKRTEGLARDTVNPKCPTGGQPTKDTYPISANALNFCAKISEFPSIILQVSMSRRNTYIQY